MKYKRQSRIIKIIKENQIKTHEQLVYMLMSEGMKVTQATVSRDIKDLGLIKVPSPSGGSVYSMPTSVGERSEGAMRSMGETIVEISCAMHTVVIKTYPGMASAMCAFLDDKMRNDFLGSVAGDDTIIIVTQDSTHAESFVKKLRTFFK